MTEIYAKVAYADFSCIRHLLKTTYETLITYILESNIWYYPPLGGSILWNFHFS